MKDWTMTKLYILNGPSIRESFELKNGPNYVGRSIENDIRIEDKTVSRKHLRIRRKDGKYFITDLRSKNGTFFNGHYLRPGIELEIKEGVPIVIGMIIVCIGKGCLEQILPVLDSINLTKGIGEQGGIFSEKRDRANQKKLELIYKVSDILMEDSDIEEILGKVLDEIFELLNRIDRCFIIVIDPRSRETRKVVSRIKNSCDNTTTIYCEEIVDRVLQNEKAVIVSNAHGEDGGDLADTLKSLKIGSLICIPLIGASKIMGVLYFDTLNRFYGFRKDDLSLFCDLGRRMALAIEYLECSSLRGWRFPD